MKKLLTAALVVATCWVLGACQGHDRVSALRNLVEEVAKDGAGYTEEKWEQANEKFSELLDSLESYEDLTPEELNEIARLQGQYAAEAFKRHGKKFQQELEKAGQMLDGFMEGLDEGLGGEED